MTAVTDLESTAGRWVVAVAVLGSSMAFLDGTAVNVALPDIGRDLGATTGQLQWVLSGYLLALASLVLLGGSLGDRYGRRRIFRIGTGLFTAASMLCAAAPTIELLIAARVLQGIGASLLTPGSLAMLESSFRPDQRAQAIGAWSGLTGVASAIGPILGGYLVAVVSWRAIFVINLPVGLFVVLAAGRHIPERRVQKPAGRLDLAGAALAAIGLAAVTFALISGPAAGLTPIVVAAAMSGIVALGAFILTEHWRATPMLPLGLFASRQFSAANLVTFVIYGAISGFFFLFVAFLQIGLGYSPVAAGAASLPVTVLMLAFSARAGKLAQRIGPRIPLAIGPVIVGAGLLLLTRIEPGDSYLTGVLPGVGVFGLGLTLVVAPITATVLEAADARDAGIASGVNNAVARVAGLLAVAVLPTIAGLSGDRFYDPSLMVAGFHVAMATCAILAIAGGVLAWFTISSTVSPERPMIPYSCAVAGPPPTTRASDTQ